MSAEPGRSLPLGERALLWWWRECVVLWWRYYLGLIVGFFIGRFL